MSQQDQKELLRRIPKDATRVFVTRQNGEDKYIPIEELEPTDIIQLKTDGYSPVVMMGEPGRKSPQDINLEPKSEEVADIMRKRDLSIANDSLFSSIIEDPSSEKSFSEIAANIAEVSALLKFERQEAERQGIDPAQMSTILNRQVSSLKTLADTILKYREQNKKSVIDVESAEFKFIFEFMILTFQECMVSAGVQGAMKDVVLEKWEEKIEKGWLEELKVKLSKLY